MRSKTAEACAAINLSITEPTQSKTSEHSYLQWRFVEERRFAVDHLDTHDPERPNVYLGSVRQSLWIKWGDEGMKG